MPSFPAGLVLQYALADTIGQQEQIANSGKRALTAFDFLELLGQSGLNLLGLPLSAGHTAHVRTIDTELAGYPAVKAAIQLVSLELRFFVNIRRHQW